MIIKDVKKQIKNTVRVYLKKNEYGEYKVPVVNQRPIFLIGPPGIGKTAIMEQIAQEMEIAIVSYSMTHHTRQSALGLPIVEKKMYGEKEYTVCEYSMSEIIGSIYETMEKSGTKEGILFLDEINCISETLTPSMLQFLQYKRFGKFSVPEGWIIITAGNPPEYNKSVKEFDIVTLDRLRVIEVDSDYSAWREYAKSKGMHHAITNYLDAHKNDFYHVEIDAGEKTYVTARGWEDLSEMLFMLEQENISTDENLVFQYIRNKDIAKEFNLYYELYKKYKGLYNVDALLYGKTNEDVVAHLKNAKFDERIAVTNLILDHILADVEELVDYEKVLSMLFPLLKQIEQECQSGSDCLVSIERKIQQQGDVLKKAASAKILSKEKREQLQGIEYFLYVLKKCVRLAEKENPTEQFDVIRTEFNRLSAELKTKASKVSAKLEASLKLIETLYGESQEMLMVITELTANKKSAKFISDCGCPLFYKYSEKLLLDKRSAKIDKEIENLSL